MLKNTEAISDEYLHVNHCGCNHLGGRDIGSLRPDGRVDYHILYIAEGCCYVTEKGNYFIYVNGGAESPYPTEDIKRLAKNKVDAWVAEHE